MPTLVIKLLPQAWVDSWPLQPQTTLSTKVSILGGIQMLVIILALTGVVFARFQRGRLSGESKGGVA